MGCFYAASSAPAEDNDKIAYKDSPLVPGNDMSSNHESNDEYSFDIASPTAGENLDSVAKTIDLGTFEDNTVSDDSNTSKENKVTKETNIVEQNNDDWNFLVAFALLLFSLIVMI